jgi:hypothetical protein
MTIIETFSHNKVVYLRVQVGSLPVAVAKEMIANNIPATANTKATLTNFGLYKK